MFLVKNKILPNKQNIIIINTGHERKWSESTVILQEPKWKLRNIKEAACMTIERTISKLVLNLTVTFRGVYPITLCTTIPYVKTRQKFKYSRLYPLNTCFPDYLPFSSFS